MQYLRVPQHNGSNASQPLNAYALASLHSSRSTVAAARLSLMNAAAGNYEHSVGMRTFPSLNQWEGPLVEQRPDIRPIIRDM